jgi:hypothetical protein
MLVFYSIDKLSSQVYKSVATIDNRFSRGVPESALTYYIAATAYARLLKALNMSGRPITNEEDSFMRMIYAGNYNVPSIIGYFMDGLGNTKLNHREVRMRAKPRKYVKSKEGSSIGWLGKINEHTHYPYAAYPCLAVYATRIVADMFFTLDEGIDPVWQLPPDVRPEDANAANAT